MKTDTWKLLMTLKRNGLGGYGRGEAQIKYAEERMGGEEQRHEYRQLL